MSDRSAIEWTDSTFNPWIGCTKVGPGCDHCYAEAQMDKRFVRARWGPGQARVRTSVANWRTPLAWDVRPFYECGNCRWRGDSLLNDGCPRCDDNPIHAIKSARRRVFCASLADVFDNEVDPAWRADLFALIRATPNLDWLLLTKRIGNASRMIAEAVSSLPRDAACGTGQFNHTPMAQWPWPNVWLGATICNQAEADRDIPKLRGTPAHVRFLSIEPMLGPINLDLGWNNDLARWDSTGRPLPLRRIDWVIAGGESGPRARPSHPDWFRSLRDQCADFGTPFLFKQWGEWWEVDGDARDPEGDHEQIAVGSPEAHELWDASTDTLLTIDGHRFTPESLPEDVQGRLLRRIGKIAAGRLLDGREHNAYPTP